MASLCLAFGALCGAFASGQGVRPSLPEVVPGFVNDALRISVADFAFALAEAHVSAGFVAFEQDFDWDPAFRSTQTVWNAVAGGRNHGSAIPLSRAIEAFAARYPAYAIERHGKVLLIRAKAIGTIRWLDTDRVPRFSVYDVYVPTAFSEAQRLVVPSSRTYAGAAGSSMSETPPVFEKIQLDLANVTVLDVLNGIAGSAPGTVWILTRHRDDGEYYMLSHRLPGGLECHFPDHLRRQPAR